MKTDVTVEDLRAIWEKTRVEPASFEGAYFICCEWNAQHDITQMAWPEVAAP